jgi:hypothetical protein
MQAFDEQIRECYRRVDDCMRGAALTSDPSEKAAFLDMQNRWLLLAQSYEFLERLSRITDSDTSPNNLTPKV